MSPMHFKAWYNLGRLHMEIGDFERAINDFSHATSIKDDYAKTFDLIGECFSRLGKEEEAELNWTIAEQIRKKNKNDN